jgi:hypothetical protein
VSEIILEDKAPTSGAVRMQGDLLHAPGHGSVNDGFLEFYPRTYGALGMNLSFQWFSSGPTASWPPENDPQNWPPDGKFFEIWHNDVYIFPETDDAAIWYPPTFPAERFAVGALFGLDARRRYSATGGGTRQQSVNMQSVVWYDLRNLPSVTVTRAELLGWWVGIGAPTPFHIDWISKFTRGPMGYRIWADDYKHGSGTAFSGMSGIVNELHEEGSVFRGVLPLQNVQPIRQTALFGLRLSFPVNPPPVFDEPQSVVSCTMNWESWNTWWQDWTETGDLIDAEFALGALPCLRIYFDDPIDEPVYRHNARNVRAARGSPRNLGRFSG